MSTDQFAGPLFLLGMPRSGTKLLRTLLNAHPAIHIAQVETHFIPYWHANWDSYDDLADLQSFRKFYDKALGLPYFTYTRDFQPVITCEDWYEGCKRYDLPGVFEALIRHDAGLPGQTAGIWGDKTPSYLTHMPLLKALFPAARFIHIVRDARDFCLSSNRAWGKHMLRSAQAWSDGISTAMQGARQLGDDYLLLRYEDLVQDPETTLRNTCSFLGVAFRESMLTLSAPAENLGDTRESSSIVAGNTTKYLGAMNPGTLRKIESITAGELRVLGYPVAYTGPIQRLSATRLWCYKLLDGVNLVRFEAGHRGLLNALKFRWRLFSTSS